jgi:hypothetical protein
MMVDGSPEGFREPSSFQSPTNRAGRLITKAASPSWASAVRASSAMVRVSSSICDSSVSLNDE